MANLTAPASVPANFNAAWGFWTNVQPYQIEWTVHATQLESAKLNATAVGAGGFWRAPELVVTNLSVELARRTAGRECEIECRHARTDVHQFFVLRCSRAGRVAPGKSARMACRNFMVAAAVAANWRCTGSAGLDQSHNRTGAVKCRRPLRLAGQLAVTNITVRGEIIDSVQAHFTCHQSVFGAVRSGHGPGQNAAGDERQRG